MTEDEETDKRTEIYVSNIGGPTNLKIAKSFFKNHTQKK